MFDHLEELIDRRQQQDNKQLVHKLLKLSQNDSLVSQHLEFWKKGLFNSFEEMLISLVLGMTEYKDNLLKALQEIKQNEQLPIVVIKEET